MTTSAPLTLTLFKEHHRQEAQYWFQERGIDLVEEVNSLIEAVMQELNQICATTISYSREILWEKFIIIATKILSQIQSMKDKNFGLTEMMFQQLSGQVQAGKETMFKEVFMSHFEDCIRYLQKNYQASYDDAYDSTMNAMLLFYKKMRANKISYGNLRFLYTQMAGQIYLKWLAKKNQKTVDITNMEFTDMPPKELAPEAAMALENAWKRLCKECKHLLENHFYEGISLIQMAAELNKPSATLRKQKQRCMAKLRASFFTYFNA